MEANERIIVALDVDTMQHVGVITHRLDGLVKTYKVGWRLFMAEGMDAVRRLSNQGYDVFLDLKIDDIPSTVQAGINNLPRIHNLKFMTFQGNWETLWGMQQANKEIKYLYVPVLSTRGLPSQLSGTFENHYLKEIITDTMKAKCDGLIASGDRIEFYRKHWPDTLIVAPGIRPLNSKAQNNHIKSCTPGDAVKMGADYIVVGRPVTEAKDPKQVVEDITKEIEKALR